MIRLLMFVVVMLPLTGCSLGYYAQAMGGQMTVMTNRISIDEMINNPDEHPGLVERLRLVVHLRDYGIAELGLPESDSFKTYVHLETPYAVWNVVAAPEFSLQAKTWCYLIVGCLSYRGYFEEHKAERYADKMRRQGFDVSIGGVLAYSTLGWFDDPLFSTVINLPDASLAEIIFHELAHEVLFVADDSDFNEAFATTVGEEGVNRWLKEHGTVEELEEYHAALRRQSEFVALLSGTRRRLLAVYDSGISAAEMRREKQEIFVEMKDQYREIRNGWDNFDGYDWWFERELNNSHVTAVDTYRRLRPAFTALLASNDFDLERFYVAARELATMEKPERDREIEKLLLVSGETQ